MDCPNCGKGNFAETEVEREFQFGYRRPVMLKATSLVEICQNCSCEIHDWRMEKAKSLALSAYLREQHESEIEPSEDLRIGHAASSRHKKQLEHVGNAGCFYCLKIFPVANVEQWVDDGQTALCPLCGIDSVVPATDETTPEFLKKMQQFWFDAGVEVQ